MRIYRLAVAVVLILSAAAFVAVTPASAQFSDTWEFHKALKDRDYREMLSRLNSGANINRANGDGLTAIVVAADDSDQQLIRFLVENGAKVDGPTVENQETALMRRSATGDANTVRLLLELGADPNAVDRRGETALMKAARNRKRGVVKALLEAGADAGVYDYTGRSALQYARDARATSIVRLLEAAME